MQSLLFACLGCDEPRHHSFRVERERALAGSVRVGPAESEEAREPAPAVVEPEVIEPEVVEPEAGDDDDGAGAGNEDARCPEDMRLVDASCIDRWEAPNTEGEPPLVMYTFHEAEAWCAARDKRLCFDDEWLAACAGPEGFAYPYGNTRIPGRCNDDRIWRLYRQSLLNGWPSGASSPAITTLDELMQAARARGQSAAAAADHVMQLYQGTAAGERMGCAGSAGVEDLVGNAEEWVRRRDGGDGPDFSGALVGRYWAESRTCRSHVTVHGNAFRFYEIGFRCCRDAMPPGSARLD